MINDNLRTIIDKNKERNSLYLRNLLKEQLQLYILNYIYNSSYGERFLFKGGTCLRYCFDLPRLSEDLDFDIKNYSQFDHNQFAYDIQNYFRTKLKYQDIGLRISGKNKILYVIFPILNKVNFPVRIDKPSENNLFVRIDTSNIRGKHYSEEVSLKSTYDFSFVIKRYSLPDMYAGKLAAIISREKWEGNEKQARFKGRDYFDIFWLDSKKIVPNIPYLQSILNIDSKEKIVKLLKEKLKEAGKRKQELKDDLFPFFSQEQFVKNFIDSFTSFSKNYSLK